ncbi:amino acid permease [Flavobacterium sp.]|jgi:APA family basic amino acid/polyamine antiporter|uniref:amino acid permease n=1 Tax=Flavobacterium sp. TaxID=239 RepID=UPI0037C192BE
MLLSKLFRKKSTSIILQQGGDGEEHSGLNKVLNVRDLTFFGIAAIIGGGTFSAIGNACFSGGPGVIFLYIICAIACGFTAMCYAEFASRVPVSGSAYTYAYVSFGELFAWIIGWALIMEYSIGNIYIAFSWSGYFTNLLDSFHLHLPEWLTINYKSAQDAFVANKGTEGLLAWKNAPVIGGLKIIFDLPAVIINLLITYLVYRGTKESRNFSNVMVYIKLAIIFLIIIVGAFYIDIDNWTPFMPNGFSGVMGGVSAVFFAYIGFDAVSTLAEETKNPQRDLPKGMIYSLAICTVIFIVLALVITGMVSYQLLGVSDPLAEIFALKGVKWMLFIVSIAAVVAMTSVLLVFQMGQPRIWMTMSRDGLMPKKFSEIHPKYKTPGFATIVTGLVVGIPIFFTDENFVLDFTSIGTLFAFVLVCGGVLLLSPQSESELAERATKGKFRIPYINAKYIFPLMCLAAFGMVQYYLPTFFPDTFRYSDTFFTTNIPMLVFITLCIVMAILSFIKNLSLIPLLGLISCCYLLTGMAVSNWQWFGIWLLIGLVIYFLFGYKNSNLNKK